MVAALDAESLESKWKLEGPRVWWCMCVCQLERLQVQKIDTNQLVSTNYIFWYCRYLRMLKASHVISWKYQKVKENLKGSLDAFTATVGNSPVGAPPRLFHLSLAQNHAEAGGWPVKAEDTNDNDDHDHNHSHNTKSGLTPTPSGLSFYFSGSSKLKTWKLFEWIYLEPPNSAVHRSLANAHFRHT